MNARQDERRAAEQRQFEYMQAVRKQGFRKVWHKLCQRAATCMTEGCGIPHRFFNRAMTSAATTYALRPDEVVLKALH